MSIEFELGSRILSFEEGACVMLLCRDEVKGRMLIAFKELMKGRHK